MFTKLTYNNSYGYTGPRPHAAITIGIYTFEFDANGNPTSRSQQPGPRRQMIWDEEDRLACSHENVQSQTLPQTPASCDNAGGTPNNARYFYDDQGQRIIKDDAQFHVYPNQNFSIRGNHQFKHVFIGTTKLLTKTVEAEQKFEDQQFYNHADHLGSTGFVTDVDGGLAEHLMYIPGGETWVEEKPVQPVPLQYTGKEFDPQTGYYYYGARYYDPQTAQWQGTDPALPDSAKESVGLSTYAYAADNPLSHNDPDGREPRTPIAAGGGGTMDPNVIRFTQDSVGDAFNDRRPVQQMVEELKANPAKAGSVEPIKIFRDRGVWFTLDNRRVVAFQKAGVQVPYEMATVEEINAAREAGKFTTTTTTNDGVSIKIRNEGKPPSQWETHYVKNPGTANSSVSRLSPTNRGLKCAAGIPCGPIPEPPGGGGWFFKTANFIGKSMNVLMIFQALKADHDHYTDPKPREPGRKVMMIWPFPGFTFTPVEDLDPV
jgi:RHS repeat-associated protein